MGEQTAKSRRLGVPPNSPLIPSGFQIEPDNPWTRYDTAAQLVTS